MTPQEAEAKRFFYRGRVRSVYDGDTVRMDIDLGMGVWVQNHSIRLWGIDTPEIRTKDPEEKRRGYNARDALREMVLGEKVYIETFKDKSGKYGRLLGVIWADLEPTQEQGSGGLLNVNLQLVLSGLAEPTEKRYIEAKKAHIEVEKGLQA